MGQKQSNDAGSDEKSSARPKAGGLDLRVNTPEASIKLPRHWVGASRASKDFLPVDLAGQEGRTIVERLQADIPGVRVTSVTRVQNSLLWLKYAVDRLQIGGGRNDWAKINEMWLWHGTDALSDVMETGFNAFAYANLDFNAYGMGNYFAPDAKLSDFFIRAQRGAGGGEEKKLILARVACGTIAEKQSLVSMPGDMQALLKLSEHRKAPSGAHSTTGRANGTEIIVYSDTQAYPAYVVTYQLPAGGALPNPYVKQRTDPSYLRRHDDRLVKRWELGGGRRKLTGGGGESKNDARGGEYSCTSSN